MDTDVATPDHSMATIYEPASVREAVHEVSFPHKAHCCLFRHIPNMVDRIS